MRAREVTLQVRLLYFEGCPHWRTADERLRQALERVERRDVEVERRQVTDVENAEREGLRGSPTVLVDGRDPFADEGAPVGLTCRIYQTDQGAQGAPTVEQLIGVLDE